MSKKKDSAITYEYELSLWVSLHVRQRVCVWGATLVSDTGQIPPDPELWAPVTNMQVCENLLVPEVLPRAVILFLPLTRSVITSELPF